MKRTRIAYSLAVALLSLPIHAVLPAMADELTVFVGQQGADKSSLARPAKGMTAAQVESKFGAPVSRGEPVGKPPISAWEYPEYRVFFEADRVLHTVLKPMPTEPEVPAAEAPAAEPPAAAPASNAEVTPPAQ